MHMATAQNDTLFLLAGVFSVCFYLFLEYSVAWEIGARDKIKLDGGRIRYTPYKGICISAAANIVNFILGIMVVISFFSLDPESTVLNVVQGPEWAVNMYGITSSVARFIQSMYIGIIQTYSPYNPIIFILIVFPAVIISGLGYFIAIKGKSILGMLGISGKKK